MVTSNCNGMCNKEKAFCLETAYIIKVYNYVYENLSKPLKFRELKKKPLYFKHDLKSG